MSLTLDLHDKVPRLLYFAGANEPEEMQLVQSEFHKDWIALDIGAHIGSYTLFMAHLLDPSQGRVYAFEPSPHNFEKLKHHTLINKLNHVEIYNMAVGSEDGEIDFYLASQNNSSMSSMYRKEQGYQKTTVPVCTLEHFVHEKKIQRLNFIKMDVEGAEPDVIEGGRDVLLHFAPHMLLELNGILLSRRGSHPGEMVKLLQSLNYSVFPIDRPTKELSPHELSPTDFVNVFCKRK